jgi:hypothetical protein
MCVALAALVLLLFIELCGPARGRDDITDKQADKQTEQEPEDELEHVQVGQAVISDAIHHQCHRRDEEARMGCLGISTYLHKV